MQIATSMFDWNSFQFFNFTFVQLSCLSFKFIQFSISSNSVKKLLLSMQSTNEQNNFEKTNIT